MYGFQKVAVELLEFHTWDSGKDKRDYFLLADEQGLGKTITAIKLAERLEYKKILVICPASLRLMWRDEMKKWYPGQDPVPVLSGATEVDHEQSVIVSYHLVDKVKSYKPDFIIVDEAHYLKNIIAAKTKKNIKYVQRTQKILRKGGIIHKAPGIFLTGTPLPNGKPNELWPILKAVRPDIINNQGYDAFVRKYCDCFWDDYELVIKGAKPEKREELSIRLRASGFMIRRLKKDVLTQLPNKRFKMVIFPQNQETAKIIEKESEFSVEDIVAHGVPAGSGLPELRREMGIAKLPLIIEYVKNLLDGGTQKVVVFCHHVDVAQELYSQFLLYRSIIITGRTSPKGRSVRVKKFQTDPECRVFIGNEAAEEGITLTAASDVVLAEPEWVPGKNDQRVDRLHRIGQENSVLVHLLVVENSLDAKILKASRKKKADSEVILK